MSRKRPYKFPLRSRAAMAYFVAFNCGQYNDRHDRYPLNYYVKADHARFDFAQLWEKYGDEFGPREEAARGRYKELAEANFDEYRDRMFNWGLEEAQRSVLDSDTYAMVWDAAKPEKVEFVFCGRSGGHLCIARVNGWNLRVGDQLLYQEMMDPEQWSMQELRLLYKLAVQWKQDFTSKNASAEVEYQGFFQYMANTVDPMFEEAEAARADHEQVVEAANVLYAALGPARIYDAVKEEFNVLCRAAGVLDKEITVTL